MTDAFLARMVALDAIVERCRGRGAFANGTVRDASNRSGRDWPFWGIEIERSWESGFDKCRTAAGITLNCAAPGVPSVFRAQWSARIWQGVSVDSFRQRGDWPLSWQDPSPDELDETMAALLAEAGAAIALALRASAVPRYRAR